MINSKEMVHLWYKRGRIDNKKVAGGGEERAGNYKKTSGQGQVRGEGN